MVKQLFKHEFSYYFRTFALFLLLLPVVGAVAKIFSLIAGSFADIPVDNDFIGLLKMLLSMTEALAYAMVFIGSAGLILMSAVICIVRFYKNLFTAEGYLSLTLPVNNHQHILVKLTVSTVFMLLSALSACAAIAIAFSGEMLNSFLRDWSLTFRMMYAGMPAVHMALYTLEYVLILLVSLASAPLLFYACIAVGQLARKNRILMAIVAYIVHYAASQFLGMVLALFLVFGLATLDAQWIHTLLNNDPFAFMHIILCICLASCMALAALYYFITVYIMNKKLNLE